MSAATKLAPDDPRHGTDNGYRNLGCRCPDCREAASAYIRRYMRRYRNSHGEWGAEARRRKYAQAREAGYNPREASRRAHWSDPLADRSR